MKPSATPVLLGLGALAGVAFFASRKSSPTAGGVHTGGIVTGADHGLEIALKAGVGIIKGLAEAHPINGLPHGLHAADLTRLRAAAEKAPKQHLSNDAIRQVLGIHSNTPHTSGVATGWGFGDIGGHQGVSIVRGMSIANALVPGERDAFLRGMAMAHPIEGVDLMDIAALQGAASRNNGTLDHSQIQHVLAAMHPHTEAHRHAAMAHVAQAHGGSLPAAAQAAFNAAFEIAKGKSINDAMRG